MLRELCTTFETAHHNQYQHGLHSQSGPRACTMTRQYVIERKSDKNERFLAISPIFYRKRQVHGGYVCSGNCVQPLK